MIEDIRLVQRPVDAMNIPNPFGMETARQARAFHESFPEYSPTPLVRLKALAQRLGVSEIHVKDESKRFGLNAFKVLGGSHAIGRTIAQKLGMDFSDLSCETLTSADIREKLGETTFITATDGNHGRGVAWTARRLGQKSVVYMPKGTVAERLENIRRLGATADITDMNYDDTVRMCSSLAEKHGWTLVQDTSWDGYEQIPLWIMQGYTTMGLEILEQLGEEKPTHIFLQAGVGAMAGAIAGFFADCCMDNPPIITIVEPDKADCFYRTAGANDGKLHAVGGDLNTIMAGLACGEPCPLGWEILRRTAENFISMPDAVAARGMRILGNPLPDDERIISGESGAAPLGLVVEALENAELRRKLKLDENSRILCISTEGDTDQENYRRIVWDGAY